MGWFWKLSAKINPETTVTNTIIQMAKLEGQEYGRFYHSEEHLHIWLDYLDPYPGASGVYLSRIVVKEIDGALARVLYDNVADIFCDGDWIDRLGGIYDTFKKTHKSRKTQEPTNLRPRF